MINLRKIGTWIFLIVLSIFLRMMPSFVGYFALVLIYVYIFLQLAKLGPIDLLLGGSPCNDLSRVNPRRKGLYGESCWLVYYFMSHLTDVLFWAKRTNVLLWAMQINVLCVSFWLLWAMLFYHCRSPWRLAIVSHVLLSCRSAWPLYSYKSHSRCIVGLPDYFTLAKMY